MFSILAILLVAQLPQHAAPPAPKQAPGFAFTIPGQGRQELSSYRGKIVILEFIHTTCAACEAAVQAAELLQKEYASSNVQIIPVAFNPNASVLVEKFKESQHLSLPVGWAARDQVCAFLGLHIRDRFGVPQVVVIDQAGKVRSQSAPEPSDESWSEIALRRSLQEIFASKPNRPAP